MPSVMYACKICGAVFHDERKAEECEARGLERAPPVGLVYRWYRANLDSYVVGVRSVKHEGHKATIDYVLPDDDGDNMKTFAAPDNNRKWSIGLIENVRCDQGIYDVLRELARYLVTPKLLLPNVDGVREGGCMVDGRTESYAQQWIADVSVLWKPK